jgi:hypothetical protein
VRGITVTPQSQDSPLQLADELLPVPVVVVPLSHAVHAAVVPPAEYVPTAQMTQAPLAYEPYPAAHTARAVTSRAAAQACGQRPVRITHVNDGLRCSLSQRNRADSVHIPLQSAEETELAAAVVVPPLHAVHSSTVPPADHEP